MFARKMLTSNQGVKATMGSLATSTGVSSPGSLLSQSSLALARHRGAMMKFEGAVGVKKKHTVAIRREDVNVWEGRAPLAPVHVRQLVKDGFKVLVQPTNRRAYPMEEYARSGAVIQEDLSEASVILGVKQVPIDLLIPDKTYAFFSHTIKAQEANMPLLDAILEKRIVLIDYEMMRDEKGQRVVAFGKYAGVAGMIDILHGLGLRLLALGHHTPFMHVGPAHNYRSPIMARAAVRDAGYEIALGLLPKSIGPLTFVFTGSGNVSQGAQEVFQELPYEFVKPKDLKKVAEHGSTNKVYGCVVDMEDHLLHKDSGKFHGIQDFFTNPQNYASHFAKTIAPYTSALINGIYWAPGHPRLLSIPDAKNLIRPYDAPWIPESAGCPHLPHRMLAISDITADPGGSIEFCDECTTIDKPFTLYDADLHKNTVSFVGPGILVCSIDNMPAQIPRESTEFFGNLLLPHVYDMAQSRADKPWSEVNLPKTVSDAVITSNGSLTPNFEYIAELRKAKSQSVHKAAQVATKMKKVLVLGAGYVSSPVVEYLTRDNTIQITLASHIRKEADAVAARFENTEPILLNVMDEKDDHLRSQVAAHDLVISLLPYQLHAKIAKICIDQQTNMVTASYTSDALKELNEEAKAANITVVNEVGVDPGIDHMIAMECFDAVKNNAGKVTKFISYCGGLPAPEDSENALRYKFSWSPRGVLLNTISPAKYLWDGKVVDIPAGGAVMEAGEVMNFLPGFNLEGFPNRDSLPYGSEYGIQKADTIIRGTLRYEGYTNAILGLQQLGFIDPNPHPLLHPQGPDMSWKEFLCTIVGKPQDIIVENLKDAVLDRLGGRIDRLKVIENLGLFEDEPIEKHGSILDTLSAYLARRLVYGDGERDIIIMRHDVHVEWPDKKEEIRHLDFVCYGDGTPDGYSAMAKTVGYPCAIAAKMVLTGEIQDKGMVVPMSQHIYRPILNRLAEEGFVHKESVTHL